MNEHQSFVPPSMVKASAGRGLQMHREFGKGGQFAAKRAEALVKGEAVSMATIRRMSDFFKADDFEMEDQRHGGPSDAAVTWLMWGGDAARKWADDCLARGSDDMAKGESKRVEFQFAKADERLGVVFGYAIVCKVDGEDFFDSQGDHIPETAMLDATVDFMAGDRMAKVMHQGDSAGQIVFGFPLTGDIAKALGVTIEKSGFVIGMKPDDPASLEKFRDGTFTGFSIGGRRVAETVLED